MPAPRAQRSRGRSETAPSRLSPWLLQVLGIHLTEMKGTIPVPFSSVFAFLVSGVASGPRAQGSLSHASPVPPALPWHCEACYLALRGGDWGQPSSLPFGEPR